MVVFSPTNIYAEGLNPFQHWEEKSNLQRTHAPRKTYIKKKQALSYILSTHQERNSSIKQKKIATKHSTILFQNFYEAIIPLKDHNRM